MNVSFARLEVGALGDGRSHPLSERFETLDDARSDYDFLGGAEIKSCR